MNEGLILDKLKYNPISGEFSWSKRMRGVNYNSKPGYISDKGNNKRYLVITINGVGYYAHRLAFVIMNGVSPQGVIDHIDGHTLNNSWDNLRCGSQSDNLRNLHSIHSDNTSGVTGISWNNTRNKWKVYIGVNGKRKHLGTFACLLDAVACRMNANIKYGFNNTHGKL